MAAVITTASGQTTIAFTFTAATQKALDSVGGAAEALYSRGFGSVTAGDPPAVTPFENLANQQKANIVDAYILRIIRDLARENHVYKASDAVSVSATAEAKVKFIP